MRRELAAISAELRRTREELAESQLQAVLARDAQLALLHARADELAARSEATSAAAASIAQRVDDLHDLRAIAAWIAHAPLPRQPLISVALPTRDRPAQLARAIDSVRNQRYEHWELLIVDDGVGDDPLPASDADARIRRLSTPKPGSGACAARNVALRTARGEIVAYLDDDNMMDRDWLQAVAWAFERHPEYDVLYGAFLVDDMSRLHHGPGGDLPRAILHRWNRAALAIGNLSDMSAIAHRAALPGAWFDESLVTMGDWDLLARLTAERDPLVLPAIACLYTTDAPDRLSGAASVGSDSTMVGARAAAMAVP